MNNVFKDVTITHKLLLIVLGLMCTNQLNAMSLNPMYYINRNRHWCERWIRSGIGVTQNWQVAKPTNDPAGKYINLEHCRNDRSQEGLQTSYFPVQTSLSNQPPRGTWQAPSYKQDNRFTLNYRDAYKANRLPSYSNQNITPRTSLGIA